ncbi:hypothetical protein GGR50DRAFT_659597 [Xylaria sp. CBS 124048]|nr:hypothetical protein GGR50DRAFT_659597 [Xylaria sp. CBS 124048]
MTTRMGKASLSSGLRFLLSQAWRVDMKGHKIPVLLSRFLSGSHRTQRFGGFEYFHSHFTQHQHYHIQRHNKSKDKEKSKQKKSVPRHKRSWLTFVCESIAFILYRQYWQKDFADKHPGLANPEISKLIGEKWREQPEPDKNEWKKYAEAEKLRHQKLYPNYRYQPRRGGKNGSGRPTSSNGENPGRCPKCGGRYIVAPGTPGTPGTAFSIASPPPSKRPPTMQPFMNENHSRHGSISGSLTPVDGHGRRYAQQHPRDMDEDYPMMSPMAAPLSGVPPEAKRRRYNGPPVYVPGSPHMGYTSIDSRYQQRGVAPMSATGYGPGHFPRPTMQHRPGMYAAQPNNPHMQPPPPPRQSMSYQPMVTTPSRPNSGFDESLRLPPLQTQPQESPTVSSELSARQAVQSAQHHPAPGPGPGPGPGSARQQPQSQLQLQPQPPPPASPMLQKWPFMLKLEVLRSISPPLRPPGPGGPHFEIRGPIIAVEGAPTPILKEVAAVIEKALSVSAEFAVRVWSEDTSTAIAHSSPETRVNGGGDANGVSDTHENETQNHNSKNGNDNTNSGNNGDAIVAAVPKKPASLVSPIASYVARMLKWHKTSEDLIRYITNYPTPPQNGGDSGTNDAAMSSRPRLPIAILSDGYSFTFSERYASALHVNDAYRADDHWQWVATLWRGIVGADLTVYVKKTAEEAKGGNANGINNSVEIVGPGIMVLHVPDGGRVDEKLERRLGFEIAEWVRGGSFVAGFKGM